MSESRSLPSGATWLSGLMQKLGYSTQGICSGVSRLAVHAHLVNQIGEFDERLYRIYDRSQMKHPVIDLNMYAFFDGVVIFSEPNYFMQIQGARRQYAQQEGSVFYTPLMQCSALDKEAENPMDCIQNPLQFCGGYSDQDLQTYFKTLLHAIQSTGAKPTHPVILELASNSHSITVAYDVESENWMLTDSRHLPTQYFKTTEEIATAVNYALDSNLNTLFSTSCFATNTQSSEIGKILKAWVNHPDYQAIHSIAKQPEKAVWKDVHHASLLAVAARIGDVSVARELIAQYAKDPIAQQAYLNLAERKSGATPLIWAVGSGKAEMVRMLLENGAQVDKPNPKGLTPLFLASMDGNTEVVQALLEAGANPNVCCNKNAEPPLYIAVLNGYPEIVALLLKHGANPDIAETEKGHTPIHLAVMKGDEKSFSHLLRSNADPSHVAKDGTTALHASAQYRRYRMLSTLTDRETESVSTSELGLFAQTQPARPASRSNNSRKCALM